MAATPARLLPTVERMTRLAEGFPTLRGAPGVQPWDPAELDRWASGPAPCSAAVLAAQLVLQVYNWTAAWRSGPFELGRAIAVWDEQHRRAFAAWAGDAWLA